MESDIEAEDPLVLRTWLICRADISERYVDRVMATLDEQEVDTLHDLQLLQQLPIWQTCGLSSLTRMKIEVTFASTQLSKSDTLGCETMSAADSPGGKVCDSSEDCPAWLADAAAQLGDEECGEEGSAAASVEEEGPSWLMEAAAQLNVTSSPVASASPSAAAAATSSTPAATTPTANAPSATSNPACSAGLTHPVITEACSPAYVGAASESSDMCPTARALIGSAGVRLKAIHKPHPAPESKPVPSLAPASARTSTPTAPGSTHTAVAASAPTISPTASQLLLDSFRESTGYDAALSYLPLPPANCHPPANNNSLPATCSCWQQLTTYRLLQV